MPITGLPLLDLDLCARADCFDFTMLAVRRTGRFVLRPLRSGELDLTPLDRIFPDGIYQVT